MEKGFTFFLSMILLALVGCGDQVALSGKVTYSDDGSPVPTGTVFFETDSYASRGTLTSTGTYNVGSLKEKDGIPPGTYRVYVAFQETGDDIPILEPLIDEKFTSGSTSGLTVTVPTPNGKFDFQVDRYVPKSGKK